MARWPLRSARARTTLLAALVSGTALAAGGILLVSVLDSSLRRSGDELARGRVHDLAAQAAGGQLPRRLAIGGEGVGQVFTVGGRVLAASPNVAGKPPITSPAGSRASTVRTVDGAPDDDEIENYRVWVAQVRTSDGPVTVLAGSSIESVHEATRALRHELLVALPLVVLLFSFGTWLVIGRTLRPIEDIRREVEVIGDTGLRRRVPVSGTGDEVDRLAVTMNGMLARLEEAAARQRTFVADASHELQSPIAALRSQVEVALARDGADWPTVARRLLEDADAMERLVRDLLFMARSGHEAPAPPSMLVDLDDLVLEEAARARTLTTVQVDTSAVSAAPVRGEPEELRRLVRNLLENGVRHARGRVVLRLCSEGASARLDVRDDGPGVPADVRDRVFDRFWTAEPSRSRSSGRTGLGLSIARTVAIRHGGTLVVADPDGPGGGHFVLCLPAAT